MAIYYHEQTKEMRLSQRKQKLNWDKNLERGFGDQQLTPTKNFTADEDQAWKWKKEKQYRRRRVPCGRYFTSQKQLNHSAANCRSCTN